MRHRDDHVETTHIDGRVYRNEDLREYAETLPVTELSLEELRAEVGPEHIYWIDRDGEQLAPHQIIEDWEAAQQNEAWADHVASIKRANLDDPIWKMRGGRVFDGVHRLTRAVIENRPTIKTRIFDELPDLALQKSRS